MEYEKINLEKKIVIGYKEHTSNADIGKIESLWQKALADERFNYMNGRVNNKMIGLYTNYESDLLAPYDFVAGCEVDQSCKPIEGLHQYIIQPGCYAKFIVKGKKLEEEVGMFWKRLWAMELERSYQSDFEEYQNFEDDKETEIHFYIGINL